MKNRLSPEARLLVTGGAGFIGSCFIRQTLANNPGFRILNLDKLTYAGNLENLRDIADAPNYRFCKGDICSESDVEGAFALASDAFGGAVDAVVHFAAESHVDRSIENPTEFLQTNVLGTEVMLRVARRRQVDCFVHVSTDEVYGSLGATDAFRETTPLAPNSPYAASKAGSDLMARAYFETYGFPVVITRCSNNYGAYQFPEKLIPLIIANALEDRPLPVYGDGLNVRDWIYVEDHAQGVETVLKQGRAGEVYNLGGHAERTNLDVIRLILKLVGKPESLMTFVPDRPGHDRRYAMDTTKIASELGWKPLWEFEKGMEATVQWYLTNKEWVENVRSGAYRDYYAQMYDNRQDWVEQIGTGTR